MRVALLALIFVLATQAYASQHPYDVSDAVVKHVEELINTRIVPRTTDIVRQKAAIRTLDDPQPVPTPSELNALCNYLPYCVGECQNFVGVLSGSCSPLLDVIVNAAINHVNITFDKALMDDLCQTSCITDLVDNLISFEKCAIANGAAPTGGKFPSEEQLRKEIGFLCTKNDASGEYCVLAFQRAASEATQGALVNVSLTTNLGSPAVCNGSAETVTATTASDVANANPRPACVSAFYTGLLTQCLPNGAWQVSDMGSNCILEQARASASGMNGQCVSIATSSVGAVSVSGCPDSIAQCAIVYEAGCCLSSLSELVNISGIPGTPSGGNPFAEFERVCGVVPPPQACVVPGFPVKVVEASWRITGLDYAAFAALPAVRQAQLQYVAAKDIAFNLGVSVSQVAVNSVASGSWVVGFEARGQNDSATEALADVVATKGKSSTLTFPELSNETSVRTAGVPVANDPSAASSHTTTQGNLPPPSVAGKKNHTWLIVGCVLGGIAVLALVGAAVWYYRKSTPADTRYQYMVHDTGDSQTIGESYQA